MINKEKLIKNEMKHLSKEFRTNYQKMDHLLHVDFFEIGASGKTYNKVDILNAIPLECHNYEIRDFSFTLKDDYIIANYLLIKDFTEITSCESKWGTTSLGLKLLYFKNSKIVK